MTNNDADWSTFWTRGSSRANPPSASSFFTGKHVAEDTDITRADETVGYIVFEEGSGTVGTTPYEAVLGADIVLGVGNGGTYSYTFAQAFASTPAAAVVTMAFGDLTRVNGNILGLQSLFELQRNNSELGMRQLRLATGARINSAEEDAASLSVATKLESRVRGQAQALANIGDAKSMLSVAEGSMNVKKWVRVIIRKGTALLSLSRSEQQFLF